MRNRILKWLFGTEDVKKYFDVLEDSVGYFNKYRNSIDTNLETLESWKEDLDLARKLIKVCENHGIDVDKEISKIKL